MAASQKRPLPPKVQAMKARKRQRIEQEAQGDDPELPSKVKAKRTTTTDNLSWKAVETPDLLDDYEGFFGLEEIEGVDVIKDASTGRVSYHATDAGEHNDAPMHAVEPIDDWTGFDDGATDREVKPSKSVKSEKKATSSKASSTPKQAETHRDGKKQSQKVEPNAVSGSVFAKLSKITDDAEADVSKWSSLKLAPEILAGLSRLRFSKPTAIQEASIPAILDGHDVIGKASTGSGKTLAYGIPILERYFERGNGSKSALDKAPLALVLSPTRELAHQIHKHLTAICSGFIDGSPSIVPVTGGLSMHKQQRLLQSADIIIGTPGRLWELIGSNNHFATSIRHIQYLVIDEADRLLSEGHFKEFEEVLNALDRQETTNDEEEEIVTPNKVLSQRQTLVFSATFDKSLQKRLNSKAKYGGDLLSNKESREYLLAKIRFREEQPKFIDVDPVSQMATGLKEGLIECGAMEKDLYLYATLLNHRNFRTLVFTNSIAAVRRITPLLQNLGLPALALHSGMIQKARLRSIERFTQEKQHGSILVATDVAARGLDISNVQLVVHYHLPRAADVYVHRSGRTARAGQGGSSILICSPEEVAGVRRLIAKVHAQSASKRESTKEAFYIRTLDPDRKIIARLKPRVTLAKKLADITIAKEKTHKEDDFLHAAAEELGVEYDSDEFQQQARGKHGRGNGRKQKERQASIVPKAEVSSMKAELKELLKERINVGVSEKYITAGRVDVDELLRQQNAGSKTGEFLGTSSGFGMDDA